jgi:sugar lactone lactonase YvrE
MIRAIAAFAFAVLAVLQPAVAHPGNGIVVAPDGTVYFADVHHETIWKVVPDGAPVVADRRDDAWRRRVHP